MRHDVYYFSFLPPFLFCNWIKAKCVIIRIYIYLDVHSILCVSHGYDALLCAHFPLQKATTHKHTHKAHIERKSLSCLSDSQTHFIRHRQPNPTHSFPNNTFISFLFDVTKAMFHTIIRCDVV